MIFHFRLSRCRGLLRTPRYFVLHYAPFPPPLSRPAISGWRRGRRRHRADSRRGCFQPGHADSRSAYDTAFATRRCRWQRAASVPAMPPAAGAMPPPLPPRAGGAAGAAPPMPKEMFAAIVDYAIDISSLARASFQFSFLSSEPILPLRISSFISPPFQFSREANFTTAFMRRSGAFRCYQPLRNGQRPSFAFFFIFVSAAFIVSSFRFSSDIFSFFIFRISSFCRHFFPQAMPAASSSPDGTPQLFFFLRTAIFTLHFFAEALHAFRSAFMIFRSHFSLIFILRARASAIVSVIFFLSRSQ